MNEIERRSYTGQHFLICEQRTILPSTYFQISLPLTTYTNVNHGLQNHFLPFRRSMMYVMAQNLDSFQTQTEFKVSNKYCYICRWICWTRLICTIHVRWVCLGFYLICCKTMRRGVFTFLCCFFCYFVF